MLLPRYCTSALARWLLPWCAHRPTYHHSVMYAKQISRHLTIKISLHALYPKTKTLSTEALRVNKQYIFYGRINGP
jgi:hypothetical protein